MHHGHRLTDTQRTKPSVLQPQLYVSSKHRNTKTHWSRYQTAVLSSGHKSLDQFGTKIDEEQKQFFVMCQSKENRSLSSIKKSPKWSDCQTQFPIIGATPGKFTGHSHTRKIKKIISMSLERKNQRNGISTVKNLWPLGTHFRRHRKLCPGSHFLGSVS